MLQICVQFEQNVYEENNFFSPVMGKAERTAKSLVSFCLIWVTVIKKNDIPDVLVTAYTRS